MGLPNKVRFGSAAGELYLHHDQETAPHYRMVSKDDRDQHTLIQMAEHLSAQGIEPVLRARHRLYPRGGDYDYPLSFIKIKAFSEAMTEIVSVSVPPEETENLLTHDACEPICP